MAYSPALALCPQQRLLPHPGLVRRVPGVGVVQRGGGLVEDNYQQVLIDSGYYTAIQLQ